MARCVTSAAVTYANATPTPHLIAEWRCHHEWVHKGTLVAESAPAKTSQVSVPDSRNSNLMKNQSGGTLKNDLTQTGLYD